jgi:hypothetical protein
MGVLLLRSLIDQGRKETISTAVFPMPCVQLSGTSTIAQTLVGGSLFFPIFFSPTDAYKLIEMQNYTTTNQIA